MVGQGHRTCGLLVAGLVGLAQGSGFGDGTGARRRRRPIQADRRRSRLVCEDQELRCAATAPIRRKICCTPARRKGVTMLTLRTLYFEDLSVGMTEPVDEDRGIVRCGRLRRGQRRSQSDPSVGACRRQDAVRHAHRSRPLLSFENSYGRIGIDSERWLATNAPREGSWWPAWNAWLADRERWWRRPPIWGERRQVRPLGDGPLRVHDMRQAER